MNKSQKALAGFMEKWGKHLPSDAWMDMVKVMTEFKEHDLHQKNNFNRLEKSIEDMEARLEEVKDLIEELSCCESDNDDE